VKNVGLYFGSFNPIHIGHLIVAEHFTSHENLDEVWLVVSPLNPLKQATDLAPENHRLAMVELATANNHRLQSCDIEMNMPRPSYTCDTLKSLGETFPTFSFTLIMGEDNLASFDKWKNYQWILENFPIRIYSRHDSLSEHPIIDWKKYDFQLVEAPRVECSSTRIREQLKAAKSIRYLVHDDVINYIRHHRLYDSE